MRRVVLLGLAGILIAPAGQSGAGAQPLPAAPAPAPVESFVGDTPRVLSPAYWRAPDAGHALAAVDAGLKRVWELSDPRDPLVELIRAAAEVDPVAACDRVRAAGVRLQQLRLPPARRVVWGALARAVAPQDRDLRDALLRVAVAHGRRALADDALWAPDPVTPGAIPFGDPQRTREFEKLTLEYRVRLWGAVLGQRADRAKAVEQARALFADATARGACPLGCVVRSYEEGVARDLTDLGAELFLAVAPRAWGATRTAEFCSGPVYSRWSDRQRDAFTGELARYAVENGVSRGDVLRVFARYDFPKAWAVVAPPPNAADDRRSPRREPIGELVVMWAWRDPDAALAAAEMEPDESLRRELIDQVSRVWAQKKPDQIGRAIRNQDNAVRRSWAREMAAAELAWRRQGNPPRDTPATTPLRRHPGPAKPAGTPWVPPADIQNLMADPDRAAEADRRLFEMASHMGQAAPADHAVELVSRIRSPHRAVNAAVVVARDLIRRWEVD